MASKSDYYQVTDGEWIQLPMRNYKEQCCDCGLVHRTHFRIRNGILEAQSFRDGPATGGARRRTSRPKK
jgi:hypothetical protein